MNLKEDQIDSVIKKFDLQKVIIRLLTRKDYGLSLLSPGKTHAVFVSTIFVMTMQNERKARFALIK